MIYKDLNKKLKIKVANEANPFNTGPLSFVFKKHWKYIKIPENYFQRVMEYLP